MPITDPITVALIAGEASGDLLGAGLIAALRRELGAGVRFVGVAGPAMRGAGCEAWYDARELAVMGLVEVAAHLPRLLRLRRRLVARLRECRPDVVIGIDAPDFNLPVEKKLKRAGLRTMHYVSPTVWAWRPGRAARMSASAEKVLCLFPFEPDFYADYDVAAEYVGHPLADRIASRTPQQPARAALDLATEATTVAVLPGSRRGEIQRLGPPFAEAIALLAKRRPGLQWVAPMADPGLEPVFAQMLAEQAPGVAVRLIDGQAQQAIAAADAVLVASGTATLEALLVKRPMVVAYRLAEGTRFLLEKLRLLNIDRFALPNLLADTVLVPEVLQDDVSGERLATELGTLLDAGVDDPAWLAACDAIHDRLRCDADTRAAAAVIAHCALRR